MIADALRVLALSALATGAAIVFILLLRKPLRQRCGAQAAYALWTLVPSAALVALLPAPVAPVAAPMSLIAATPAAVQTLPSTIAVVPAIDPAPWLGALWLLGAGICLALFFRQQRRFVRALGRLSPNTDRTFRAQAIAGCPALVGAWRPRIVLPADFERRYDSAERELILAHERSHRARGDAQLNALAAVLRCLYWFNPLMHIAASRFRFDQELACDATVIARFPEARRPYADAMLKTQLADLGLPAGCHWQSSHPLKERIAMLKNPLPGRARIALGLGLVAALVMGGSYAAWAVQPAQVSVENADAPASQRIHADIVLSVDGMPLDALWKSKSTTGYLMRHDAKEAPSNWEFGFIAGHPFSLEIYRKDESWRLDGTVRPEADGKFEIASTLTHNGSIVSHPKLITLTGQSAGIKSGEVKNGKFTGFGAQIVLRDGSGPVALPPPDGGDATRNIGASYRRLTRIEYPTDALVAKRDGIVYVRANVSADGRVVSTHVDSVHPVGATQLADVAIAAIKQWTFNPAHADGKPVASQEVIPVAFTLDPEADLHLEGGTLDAIRVSPAPQSSASGSVDTPASADVAFRRMHPPRYPASAIMAHEQGKVVLKVHVDANGKPIEALVDKTDPPDLSSDLGDAAIAAAMHWQFNPARKHGKAIDGWVLVPFTFSLTEL